jgi:VanZ family protein
MPPGGPAGAGPDAPYRAASRAGRVWWWIPALAYMGAIFYLSSQSQLPIGPDVSDKLSHVVAYFGLAVVLVVGLCSGLPSRLRPATALMAWGMAVGYGVTDEVHQMFVPYRTAALDDLVADAAGALAGVALCWAWGKMFA